MATKPEKQPPASKLGDIDAELDALAAETVPFFAQLYGEWRKEKTEIDAWLARERAELNAAFPDLAGLDCDLAEFDELLGLGNLPHFPLDLPPVHSRESPKNARTRVMGCVGDGARKSRLRCGAKTRTGKPCQAPGNGKGGRCKMHGGKSTGPRTPEGKVRALAALRDRPSRKRLASP